MGVSYLLLSDKWPLPWDLVARGRCGWLLRILGVDRVALLLPTVLAEVTPVPSGAGQGLEGARRAPPGWQLELSALHAAPSSCGLC